MPQEIEIAAEQCLDELVEYRGGTRRPAQVKLAKGLARHIESGEPVVVEAPTGIGKSYAAIAAARASGQKTLISTHTHGLQQQLQKDAEMLSEATDGFSIAILKGKSSYLCKLKESQVRNFHDGGDIAPDDEQTEIDKVLEWAEETETGDKGDIGFSVSNETWREVSVTPDQCINRKCPFFKSCFAELAKNKAKQSDIAVVNHAIIGQGMKQESFLDNAFSNIIIDEAHEFPEVVGEAFGANISSKRLKWAAGKMKRVGSVESHEKFQKALERIQYAGRGVKEPLRHLEGHPLNRQINLLLASVMQWVALLEQSKNERDYILQQNLYTLGQELQIVAQGDTHTQTSWIQWDDDHFTLRSHLFNPGAQIRMNLLDSYHSASFMSATMQIGGSFNSIATRLGLNKRKWTGAELPHIFDYENHGMIWYPNKLAMPGTEQHLNQLGVVSKRVVERAQGRTLVLSTSWNGVNTLGNKLRKSFEKESIPVMIQKPGVNIKYLAEEFMENPHSVLVGTMSLWTGMSFEGNTCIATVIDKLPFPSPADPIIAARMEQAEENGVSGFATVLLPEAIRRLKQGVGRQIRTVTDQGLIVIGDSRLDSSSPNYKQYARQVEKSLPPMRVTNNTEVAMERLDAIVRSID